MDGFRYHETTGTLKLISTHIHGHIASKTPLTKYGNSLQVLNDQET